jgi:hypothetical protein
MDGAFGRSPDIAVEPIRDSEVLERAEYPHILDQPDLER